MRTRTCGWRSGGTLRVCHVEEDFFDDVARRLDRDAHRVRDSSARGPDSVCSNTTVQGSYGVKGTGTAVSGAIAGPVAFIGIVNFDGMGQLSGNLSIRLNSARDPTTQIKAPIDSRLSAKTNRFTRARTRQSNCLQPLNRRISWRLALRQFATCCGRFPRDLAKEQAETFQRVMTERADATDANASANVTAGRKRRMARLV